MYPPFLLAYPKRPLSSHRLSSLRRVLPILLEHYEGLGRGKARRPDRLNGRERKRLMIASGRFELVSVLLLYPRGQASHQQHPLMLFSKSDAASSRFSTSLLRTRVLLYCNVSAGYFQSEYGTETAGTSSSQGKSSSANPVLHVPLRYLFCSSHASYRRRLYLLHSADEFLFRYQA